MNESSPALFTVPMEVRDYELDLQGVVNNSVYQNYLEHARHRFLKAGGINFAELTSQGVNLVVTRIELDYLAPLRSGDCFEVAVSMERVSRIRFGFRQEIIRIGDRKTMLRALVIGTALDVRGRPHLSPDLDRLLSESMRGANS